MWSAPTRSWFRSATDWRPSPYPAAVEDAWAATQWIAEHAAELGADPDRLAVAGDSAGGNLAAVVTQLARDAGVPSIRFQLLWYPSLTFDLSLPSFTENADAPILGTQACRGYTRWYIGDMELSDVPATLAPARATDLTGLPPAYIAVAGHDPLRDDGHRTPNCSPPQASPSNCTTRRPSSMATSDTRAWCPPRRRPWSGDCPRCAARCMRAEKSVRTPERRST